MRPAPQTFWKLLASDLNYPTHTITRQSYVNLHLSKNITKITIGNIFRCPLSLCSSCNSTGFEPVENKSPIFIEVHTTDCDVRYTMLCHPKVFPKYHFSGRSANTREKLLRLHTVCLNPNFKHQAGLRIPSVEHQCVDTKRKETTKVSEYACGIIKHFPAAASRVCVWPGGGGRVVPTMLLRGCVSVCPQHSVL